MGGFFGADLLQSKIPSASKVPLCNICGLYKQCQSPKMPVTGSGGKGVLIVGECPGEREDRDNEQFVGASGQLLRESLGRIGIDLNRDCWKTNAVICRPVNKHGDNRSPTDKEIDYCRPSLLATVERLHPSVIILLGSVALNSLVSPLWRGGNEKISQWVGWRIPTQRYNAWVCPNYHPSYVNRLRDERDGAVVRLLFERYLKNAFEQQGRPWEKVPAYTNDISVKMSPRGVAAKLRQWAKDGSPVSFDYETNRLKPDDSSAEIVCCSVCWKGVETISYPWVGEAVEATSELLRSPVPKIGYNNLFEERWTRKVLGHGVRNWVWDGMQGAHVADCRRGVTSAKFQAFVRLGYEPWDEEIKPYLTETDGRGVNRIRQVDTHALLMYCGIDSLVEYKIALLQKLELKENNAKYARSRG